MLRTSTIRLVRVLFIGRGVDHASTRVRLLQYRAPLAEHGADVRVLEWQPTTRAAVVRLTALALQLARWADVVVILKPRLHPRVVETIRRINPRIVVDIDDAMWTWGDVFADRFDHAAGCARAISAGSGYLATLATERYPAAITERIPTAVQLDDYPMRPPHRDEAPVVVGWIGNTASLGDFSDPVARALQHNIDAGRVTLRIVCSRPLEHEGLTAEFEPWSLDTELDSLQRFDIGIMPLDDSEGARGRCGLKAIQCMAVGVPVVASPVGAATEIIDGHSNGLLASTEDEWSDAIGRLAGSAALRGSMGARARATIEADFSVAANIPRLLALFAAVQSATTR